MENTERSFKRGVSSDINFGNKKNLKEPFLKTKGTRKRKETKPKKLHRDSEFSSVHGLTHHMLVKHQKTPNRNRNYFLSTLST